MEDVCAGIFWFIGIILTIVFLFVAGWSIGRGYLVDDLCSKTQYEFCEPMQIHYQLKDLTKGRKDA